METPPAPSAIAKVGRVAFKTFAWAIGVLIALVVVLNAFDLDISPEASSFFRPAAFRPGPAVVPAERFLGTREQSTPSAATSRAPH